MQGLSDPLGYGNFPRPCLSSEREYDQCSLSAAAEASIGKTQTTLLMMLIFGVVL